MGRLTAVRSIHKVVDMDAGNSRQSTERRTLAKVWLARLHEQYPEELANGDDASGE